MGDRWIVETKIETYSQFDLMPRWAQWSVVGFYCVIALILFGYILHDKGIL